MINKSSHGGLVVLPQKVELPSNIALNLTSVFYLYNGLDTRISKVENSVSQTFVRDGAYVTDPVLRNSTASYAIQGIKTYDAFGDHVALPASPRPKPGESMAEYQARLGLEAGETNQGSPGYGIGNPGLNGGTPLNGGENKIQPSPGGTGKGGTGNSGEYGGKLGGKGGNGKKGTVKYEQPIGNGGKITIGNGWGQEPSGFSIGLTWVWRLN